MSNSLLAKIGEDVLSQIFLISQLGTDAGPEEILKFAISFVCMSNPEYQEIAFFRTNEGVVKYNPVLIASLAERLQYERVLDTSLPQQAVNKNSYSLPGLKTSSSTSLALRNDPAKNLSLIKITKYRRQMLDNIWSGIKEFLGQRNIEAVDVEMPEDDNDTTEIKYDSWTLDIRDELNPNFDYLQTVIALFSTNIFKYCEEHSLAHVAIILGTVDDYADRKVGWWYKAKGYRTL